MQQFAQTMDGPILKQYFVLATDFNLYASSILY